MTAIERDDRTRGTDGDAAQAAEGHSWRDSGRSSPPDGMAAVVSPRHCCRSAHSSPRRRKRKSLRRTPLTSRTVSSLSLPQTAFLIGAILGPVPRCGKHGTIARHDCLRQDGSALPQCRHDGSGFEQSPGDAASCGSVTIRATTPRKGRGWVDRNASSGPRFTLESSTILAHRRVGHCRTKQAVLYSALGILLEREAVGVYVHDALPVRTSFLGIKSEHTEIDTHE
jgi:hypothetical protein